jgi:NADPH:quinone reductase-like Zn-dependent oxidoreductase
VLEGAVKNMRAVVLERSCRADEMVLKNIPVPLVKPGWVLVKVKAFGINRSEIMFRSFEADMPYIKLPRIPGIECVGEIVEPSDSNFASGQRVVALMGGMGRSFDGSYAEYALLPKENVFSVDFNGSWEELAAIPETYFTAYGSLFDCLQLSPSDKFLVRGGTSSLALASIQLAKSIGSTVIAIARKSEKEEILKDGGADHVLVDDRTLNEQLRFICPRGVGKVLELVGPDTLRESMELLAPNGIICQAGMLGNRKAFDSFEPIKDIPNGIYLCSFFSNYPTQKDLDRIFRHIKNYDLKPRISKVFAFDEIAKAHSLAERNDANGKIVVAVDRGII